MHLIAAMQLCRVPRGDAKLTTNVASVERRAPLLTGPLHSERLVDFDRRSWRRSSSKGADTSGWLWSLLQHGGSAHRARFRVLVAELHWRLCHEQLVDRSSGWIVEARNRSAIDHDAAATAVVAVVRGCEAAQ